jgi:hypothetical protein
MSLILSIDLTRMTIYRLDSMEGEDGEREKDRMMDGMK